MKEYYKKFRPRTFKTVVGQDSAVASLQMLMDKDRVPHFLLLSGPSGCGKTTLARIVKDFLDCGDNDFVEVNCADFKGIDTVREIRRSCGLTPAFGSSRVWLIDEAHKLTGDAQNAFLKLLEDTPEHVYFIFATTDPQKLIPTIHTRATEILLTSISPAAIERALQRVIDKEQLKVSKDVIDEIVDAAEGSARKALVILEQVGSLNGDKEQISAIKNSSLNKTKAIELARALTVQPLNWPEVAKMLRELKEEDPEGLRYCVLGYARSILLGANPKMAPRAFKVIEIFSEHFYNSKHAGLAAACYEVVCM